MLEAQARRFDSKSFDLLAGLLENSDPAVRARAAFTLGLDHPRAFPLLAALSTQDSSALVRASAITAATRSGHNDHPSESLALIITALKDKAPHVRGSAASAGWLLSPPTEGPDELTAALIHAATDSDHEVRWRSLFSISRRDPSAALDLCRSRALDEKAPALERLYATRALGRLRAKELDGNEAALAALAQLSREPDWRIAMEAVLALGKCTSERAQGALLEALQHPSFHVRHAIAISLRAGKRGALEDSARAAVEVLKADSSPSVRVASILAAAHVLGDQATDFIRAAAQHEDPRMRYGTHAAALAISPALALEIATRSLADSNLRVAGAGVELLGKLAREEGVAKPALDLLRQTLASPDNGLRLAAVTALKGQVKPSDLALLGHCFATSTGDIGPEVRFGIVHAVAEVVEAAPLLRRAVLDGNPHVVRVAREALNALTAQEAAATSPAPLELTSVPSWTGDDPIVLLDTTKGKVWLQLFPREAPRHVASMLTLMEQGHYDGLSFHRVVGDFVVQGGCYRGDGNGSGTGFDPEGALPAEFNPLPYLTGTLGMPRNEDPDSGGSQIFITHRPTPHLDGRYTVFGQTLRGFDVLAELEVGDRILSLKRIR